MSKLFIGTSGWSYAHWKECFYSGVPRKNRLNHYAIQFNSVEINASFYRLQTPEIFSKWHDSTPNNFYFCIKANRYLTHTKKLGNPNESIVIEKEHARHLQKKLAVVLWQLPKNRTKNLNKLITFVNSLSLWRDVRHTIEFHHPSWFEDETVQLLKKHNIAMCVSDAADWPMWVQTSANFIYVRLHGHSQTYVSPYNTSQLRQWSEHIKNWLVEDLDVYVYFDNDAQCAAPRNALELQRLLRS